jgi:hypothetical protein
VGADVQTVFDGVVTNAPVTGPGGGPKDFTVTIDIDPFEYDPSEGNLLLDVRASSGGISAAFDAQTGSFETGHVDAPSSAATAGTTANGVGLVTQFEFTTPPKTVGFQEYAFAWANQPATASYTPDATYSYNYVGGPIQITRLGTGAYSVAFTDFAALGVGGNVQVTAYGSFLGTSNYCKVVSWSLDTVRVNCFDTAGAAVDSYFTVLYVKTPSLPTALAYAWANNATSASYTPSATFSYNPTGGAVTAARSGVGAYTMTWSGFGALGAAGGHPHVTAYDSSNKRCQIAAWLNDTVTVRCFDSAGNPADSLYSVLFLRPDRTVDGLAFAFASSPGAASYTPTSFTSFNSGDGAVVATRSGTGSYQMSFGGFAGTGINGGDVQVVGFGGVDARCNVSSWDSEAISVRCHNAAGAPIDVGYNVLYLKPVAAPEPGRFAMIASGVALLGLLGSRRSARSRPGNEGGDPR